MTGPDKIFLNEDYRLSSCSLRGGLEHREADVVSGVLADLDPWQTLGYSKDDLGRYLLRRDPALKRYVVLTAQGISGVVSVRHPWLRGPYLELLAVFKPYQGRGLGREVMLWLEDQARPASKNIWVTVAAFNASALSFYDRLGFKEVGVLPELVRPGYDEILLRKTL